MPRAAAPNSRRWPALVIGGGPSGAAAAITLAQAGIATQLIERSFEPVDPVCGAFLSSDVLDRLHGLGIDAAALGARPITRLRAINGTRMVETNLPFRAAGLSRRVLDMALIEAAQAAGAVVSRGLAAQSTCLDSRSVRLKDGRVWSGEALFLATGKHELRGGARELPAGGRLAIGLRASLPVSRDRERSLDGVIELHLFDAGYAGLLLREDGSTNLCVSISRTRLAHAGSPQLLLAELMRQAPVLRERIGPNVPDRFAAIAGVPYGWHTPRTAPGVFRLGDQGAVIASLAGDGIAIAVASGQDAAAAFLARGPAAALDWQREWGAKCRVPLVLAEGLRRSAETPLARRIGLTLLQLFPSLAARAAVLTRVER
jgi:flavin-dependent dehydrogenase